MQEMEEATLQFSNRNDMIFPFGYCSMRTITMFRRNLILIRVNFFRKFNIFNRTFQRAKTSASNFTNFTHN